MDLFLLLELIKLFSASGPYSTTHSTPTATTSPKALTTFKACYHSLPSKHALQLVFTNFRGESHQFYSTTYTQQCRQHFSEYSVEAKIEPIGNSPVVQWLGLHTFTVKGPGSIPGQGTKILHSCMVRPKNKTKPKNKQSRVNQHLGKIPRKYSRLKSRAKSCF